MPCALRSLRILPIILYLQLKLQVPTQQFIIGSLQHQEWKPDTLKNPPNSFRPSSRSHNKIVRQVAHIESAPAKADGRFCGSSANVPSPENHTPVGLLMRHHTSVLLVRSVSMKLRDKCQKHQEHYVKYVAKHDIHACQTNKAPLFSPDSVCCATCLGWPTFKHFQTIPNQHFSKALIRCIV